MAQGKIKSTLQAGFTLIEVMIAMVIFTIFATAFITGQGYNLLDSRQFKDEIILKDLCENKINEIITNPPEFRESLTISKETKDFESNPDYQYTIEYKKFFVPEMSKIVGDKEDENGEGKDGNNNSPQAQLEKRMFNVFKENMEKIIWQVTVTVKNKYNDGSFSVSAWLYNRNADVQIGTI